MQWTVKWKNHTCTWCYVYSITIIFNPLCTCAARVKVVFLCVCLFSCLFVYLSVCLRLFSHYRLRGGADALRGPVHQFALRMRIISVIMVHGPIQYGTHYSSTRQFFSTTVLHLLCRGFCFILLLLDCIIILLHLHEEEIDTESNTLIQCSGLSSGSTRKSCVQFERDNHYPAQCGVTSQRVTVVDGSTSGCLFGYSGRIIIPTQLLAYYMGPLLPSQSCCN